MPWNAQHKENSRENILASAALLFTHHGFDAISIDDVMKHAGLTRGAFYAHFKSKSDMYDKAVRSGAQLAKERVMNAGITSATELAENYLKMGRPEQCNENDYCPLAFLVTDIQHQHDNVRNTYTRCLKGYQSVLSSLGLDEKSSIQASVLLVGGLAIAKAITDDHLRDAILNQCLKGVEALAKTSGAP